MERAMRALMGNNLPPRFKFKDTYDSIEVPTAYQQHLPSQATLEAKFDELIAEEETEAPTTQIKADMVVSSNLEVGTSNLFVDTETGNVGIGTTNPSKALHIYRNDANPTYMHIVSDVSNRAGIALSEDTTNKNVIIEYDGTGSGAGNYLAFYSDVSSWVGKGDGLNYVPSNGRVGIGTTNPQTKLSVAGDLTVDGKIYNYNYTEVDINAPATTSGSWSASTSSSWGDPKFNNTYNRRRYNDAPGYVEYTIPTGMKSAYVSQLQWNTGGYVDVHGVQSDGGLVFLRRINTRQRVENSNEGNPGQYDGSTITFAGSSLQHYSKIRLTNKMGRFHMTGLAFTPNENEGTEGTGMVHTAQISDLSGHPVQYVADNVHSIVSYGSTSGGRYVTPLDVTITPKFSNSKIFVQWVINFEAHQDMVFRVYRGSTLIGYNTSIANNRWNGVSTPDYDQNNSTTPGQSTISWIDSPNTTSAVTYRVYMQSSSTGSYPFYLNRTYAGNNTGQDYHERMVSYKSAMEIAV
jgi:hypothetical protein